MAKNLGIKITVDMSKANSELEAFEAKWKGLGKEPLKLEAKVDTKGITRLANNIDKIFGKDNHRDLKLNLDVSDALKNLNRFKEEFSKIKKEYEGMGFRTKKPSFELSDIKSDGKIHGFGDFDKIAQQFNELSSQSKDISVNLKRGMDGTYHTVTNIKNKIDEAKTATLKMVDGVTTDIGMSNKESANIKDYIKLYKEYVALREKSIKDSGNDIVEKQLNKVKNAMKAFKAEYKETFNKDIDSLDVVKALKDQSDFKLKLGLEAKGKEELNGLLKELKDLYGKKIKLQFEIDNAPAERKSFFKNQLKDVEKQISDSYSKYSNADPIKARQGVNSIIQELRSQEAIKNSLEEEKAVMASLVSSNREILKLKKQIAEYETYQKKGTIKSNEEYKLDNLREELKIKQNIYDAEYKANRTKISKTNVNELRSLSKAQNEAVDLAKAQANVNSKIRESQELYGELTSSIQKVVQLSRRLGSSGNSQADKIKELIRHEEDYQQAIRETIKVKGLSNSASEKQYKQAISKARKDVATAYALQPEYEEDKMRYSGLAGQVLNPRAMYQDAKQAFQTIYESVAKVDEQFVNIAKVANAPQEELDKFGENIYKQASKVGKAADEYGVSVARWLTTGKTLQQSIDLSQTSVMGSFVGNIDEESMVRYMAVPLENYKNSALEATDIINAMNEVANNNAVEMNDLGEAYARASQTASSAGTTFAQLTGLIAGANTTTRAGGEKIGTALKAIDLNASNIGAQLTKGNIEKFEWLSGHGINLKDANGQLRTTYDILTDLQKVWNNLSSNDKGTATFYLAGKHHAPILQGIVKGWSTVQKATKEAEGQLSLVDKESGSAFEEFKKQQNSVQFATAQLTNAWGEFLRTVAGGKDGVVEVLHSLEKLVNVATKLAENSAVRKLATTFGSLAGITAMTITAQRGVGGAKSIYGDAKIALGNVFGAFRRKGNKRGNALEAVVDSGALGFQMPSKNVSKGVSDMSNLANGARKTGGAFSKMGGIIRGTGAVLGGLIPIIGTTISILTLLDATGIPVFETIGKGIKGIGEHFKSASKKAKEANKEFIEGQDKVAKKLDKNKFLSNGVLNVDNGIKGYKQLVEEKEKVAKETGVEAHFSEEEFSTIKKQFNELAKENGWDVRIDINNYEDIKAKFKELIDLKNQLTADELEKLNKTFDKDLKKPKSLKEDKKAYKEELEKTKKNLGIAEEALRNAEIDKQMAEDSGDKNRIKNMTKAYEGATKFYNEALDAKNKLEQGGFFGSKYAEEADKADIKRFDNILNLRKKLAEQAKAGTLSVGFNAQSKEYQSNDLAMLVTQYNRDKENINKLNAVKQDIERAKNEYNKGNKNAKISEDTQRYLKSLGDEYANMNNLIDGNSEKLDSAMARLGSRIGEATNGNEKLKNSLRELGSIAGLSDYEMEAMFKGMEASGADFANYILNTFGEVGASLLNITSTFMDKYGDNWKQVFVDIQREVDHLNAGDKELLIKYKIVNEDGSLNSQNYMKTLGLPEEIKTKFSLVDESTGALNMGNVSEFLKGLNDEGNKEVLKSVGVQLKDGSISIDSLIQEWNKLDQDQQKDLLAKLNITVSGKKELDESQKSLKDADGKESNSTLKVNILGKEGIDNLLAQQNGLGTATAIINANDEDLQSKKTKAEEAIKSLDGKEATAKLLGDASGIRRAVDEANRELDRLQPTKTVTIVTNRIETSSGGGGKSKKEQSVAIDYSEFIKPISIDRNIGKAFSASITNALTGDNKQNTLINNSRTNSRTNPRYNGSSSNSKEEATVDESIWRYWSKELFKGIPLERSMKDLEEAIKQADDNVDKLAGLYERQRPLIEKQIEYQKSLMADKQSEMNDILAKLRQAGFNTDGNKVTNLDYAKSLKGESATNANNLLSKWKSLYEELDNIVGKISSLNTDKFELEKKIKENDIKIENEHLTKRAKIIEAYLKKISNHTDLISQKVDFVSDKDTDLKIQTLGEGIAELSKNVNDLIAQFNAIAVSTTEHKENGDVMMDNLQNIKSQILENIDAMLKWQEKIDDLRIDGLISDFDRFNNTISKNTNFLDNNITNLKEGLLNGTKYSDLQSSQLVDLTYSYRDQLQKQYQQRLEIEKALDEALEDFAERNIERTKNVANGTLLIEKQKYEQLLNMKKQFEAGVAPTYEEIDVEYKRLEEFVDGFNNKYIPDSYKAWRSQMQNVNNQYVRRLELLRSKYDALLDGARTEEEKSLVTQRLITDQLGIQRDIQQSLIDVTRQALANAQAELRNSNLTSEQQEKLLDAIQEYRQTMVDAQNKIKETIKARYDLEFEYLDKLADKASIYTSVVDNIANIAEKLNMSSVDKTDILESVFNAKVNEFVVAKSSMEKLLDEQNRMEIGSYEWNLLDEKVKDYKDKMRSFTLDMIEANKNLLNNNLDAFEDRLSRSLLNGMSYDEWDEHIDLWISGVEKELRLEEIRKRLIENENDTIRKRLEALDMQKEISKKDLEYLDKQSKLLELENKMLGIKDERNVQTLVRNENGDWNYEYVFDQSDFDKAKEDYDKARQDLEEYRTKQRGEYVKSLQDIFNKAKDGEYRTPSELSNALEKLNKVYRGVLSDIPDFNMDNGSEEILAIYKDYLEKNKSIIEDSINDKKGMFTTSDLDMWGETFKNSFIGISEKLGEVVGDAVRRALSNANSIDNKNVSSSYVIQKQELSFPSVTDTNGFEQVLKDLPRIATQKLTNK